MSQRSVLKPISIFSMNFASAFQDITLLNDIPH
jgi:hypothetical protein